MSGQQGGTHMSSGSLLLYIGAGVMAASVLLGFAAVLLLRRRGRRLREELERDYGKQQH